MRCALVYCLVVDLTISVLLPVGVLFHDVELDVGGKAAKGLPEQQCLGAEFRRGVLLCGGPGVCRQWRLPGTRPGLCAGGVRVGGLRVRRWRRPWPPAPRQRRPRMWCGPCGGPCGSVPRCGLAAGWPPPVMGVRAESPEASVKKSRSASDGCGRQLGSWAGRRTWRGL